MKQTNITVYNDILNFTLTEKQRLAQNLKKGSSENL